MFNIGLYATQNVSVILDDKFNSNWKGLCFHLVAYGSDTYSTKLIFVPCLGLATYFIKSPH